MALVPRLTPYFPEDVLQVPVDDLILAAMRSGQFGQRCFILNPQRGERFIGGFGQAKGAGNFKATIAVFESVKAHLLHRFLQLIERFADLEHALRADPDLVRHPFDVAEDLRR